MNVESIAFALSPEQLEVFTAAMEQGALFYKAGDDYYAAIWDGSAWCVYKLERTAPEYFVTKELTVCTCPAYEHSHDCKHIRMLKYGSDFTTEWDKTRIKEAKRRR